MVPLRSTLREISSEVLYIKELDGLKTQDVGVDRFEASYGDWSLWRLIATDIDIQHF